MPIDARTRRAPWAPARFASLLALASFLVVATARAAAPASAPATPAAPSHEYWVWRLLPPDDIENVREGLRNGFNPDHPLVRALRAHGAFDAPIDGEAQSAPSVRDQVERVLSVPQLGADALVNQHGLTCTGCQNLPAAQVEPSVAVHGNNVLVAFNDYGAVCRGGTRMNYGYSTNGGTTFTDALAYLSDPDGTMYGDPSVAVNHRTGQFYMGGLHGVPGVGLEIGAVRGFFSGSTFVRDLGRRTTFNADHANHFFDRPYFAVDSTSGNVYFTWCDFGTINNAVRFQALDSLLNPISPVVEIAPELFDEGYQDAQPAVGPDGTVYVVWWDTRQFVPDRVLIRRSTDHGATFGPPATVGSFASASANPAPGGQRDFALVVPSIAVDCTNGPHRGRIYVSWEGSIDFRTVTYPPNTVAIDQEPNNSRAAAQPFVPGGKIRGTLGSGDVDWFAVTGTQGQTLVLENFYTQMYDSCELGFSVRIHYWTNPADPSTERVVSEGGLYAATCLYAFPVTGTYYVEVYPGSSATGKYVFQTAVMTPGPGSLGRDQRDPLLAWSDDGDHWVTPIQLSDDPPWFDSAYPSTAVDGEGRVHCFWLDYRDDPVYATKVRAYTVASGDGGLTWGPNRMLADDASYWPVAMCLSNRNSIGDYMAMAADGDRVVAAYTDPRLGDSDIWADASVHAQSTDCPGSVSVVASPDTTIALGLTNTGNFTRSLHWELTDTRGWLVAAVPAASGTQLLASGQRLGISVTVAPMNCASDSTVLTLRISDPAIPGASQACATTVRCTSLPTATRVALVSADAQPGRVMLAWEGLAPGTEAAVRRLADGAWSEIGRGVFDGTGRLRYVDDGVAASARYAYRLQWSEGGVEQLGPAVWVEVPASLAFALESPSPNPAHARFDVAFTLADGRAAELALVDVSGRPFARRDVSELGPGRHLVSLEEGSGIPPGVYWLRLTQAGRTLTRMAVMLR